MGAKLDLTALNIYQDSSRVQTEMRVQKHGLIKLAKLLDSGAMWMSTELREKLSKLQNRSFEMPALKEETITVTDVESFDIPVNASETEVVTATKITMFSGFSYSPYRFGTNLVSAQEYKENKYNEIFKAMAKKKEEYIQAFLETQKTQVLDVTGAPTGYNFNATSDSLEISLAAQGDIMLSTLATIFEQNNLSGLYGIAGSYGLQHVVNEYTKYGANNDKNLQNQVLPVEAFMSNEIANTDRFTAYMATLGAMAMVENHLAEFRNDEVVGEKVWGITDQPVPFLDEQIMVYQNRTAGNATTPGTATPENIMSVNHEEAFVSKFYLVQKYNSDRTTRVGDIARIEGLTT